MVTMSLILVIPIKEDNCRFQEAVFILTHKLLGNIKTKRSLTIRITLFIRTQIILKENFQEKKESIRILIPEGISMEVWPFHTIVICRALVCKQINSTLLKA
jgi:hypothetical protein